MIKRDIVETVCEYDNEGKLIKKTVTETHEEDSTVVNYPSWSYLSGGGITLCNDTAVASSNPLETESHCTCNCSHK